MPGTLNASALHRDTVLAQHLTDAGLDPSAGLPRPTDTARVTLALLRGQVASGGALNDLQWGESCAAMLYEITYDCRGLCDPGSAHPRYDELDPADRALYGDVVATAIDFVHDDL